MEHAELVLKTLKEASDPLKVAEIVELSGLDRKSVDKAMKKLKADDAVLSPKNCYWSPK